MINRKILKWGQKIEMRIKTFSIFSTLILVSFSLFIKADAQQRAPYFKLTDVDGNSFSISTFQGKTVVLTFIATRVILCKLQVNILVNVSKHFGSDVAILLIGVSNQTIQVGGDTDEQLKSFREECGFEGIVARDIAGVAENYNVTYVPTTFIIDQGGYICYKHVGAVQTSEDVLLELDVIVPELSSTSFILSFLILNIIHKKYSTTFKVLWIG